MDKEHLIHEMGALSGDIGALSALLKQREGLFALGNTKVVQARVLPDILSQNWTGVANTAEQESAAAETALAGLKELQIRLNQVSLRVEAALSALKTQFTPVARRKDWPEYKAALIDSLRAKGLSEAVINTHVKRLEKSTYSTYAAGLRKPAFDMEEGLNRQFTAALAHYMGNLLALYVARFNLRAANPPAVNQNIDAYCQSVAATLAQKQKELFSTLRAADLQEAALQGDNLANFCLQELNESALDFAAAIYAKRQGAGSDFTADGRAAAATGDLLRSLLLNVAAGRYAQWVGGYHAKLHLSQEWLRQAGKLAFALPDAMPVGISIAELAANPAAHDGEELSVEGRIAEVTIRHKGRKAISTAKIEDENGNAVTIAMPYIKLDSGGMVPGAYARVAGVWLDSNKEAEGNPALSIDRLDLLNQSKSNWLAWLTLELRNAFEPVPHTLNASYSWEAGAAGAINPVRFSVFNVNSKK